jgi:uncharacterized protein (TIGR02246 family)
MPLLGTNFIETPEISGVRSIVHAALFLTFFYLGFIRKWKRHSITTYDQDNEKIREVVTTWMRATAEGDLETVLSLIAEDAVFLLPDQPPMRGRVAFAGALRSALGQVRIEGKPDIQEIHVVGDYAFCWNQLSLTVTPLQGLPNGASAMKGFTVGAAIRKMRSSSSFWICTLIARAPISWPPINCGSG